MVAGSRPSTALAEAVQETFPQHPDAEILLRFPGLGIQLAARVLAEIGDDRTRFADARAFKAYAGSSPITRASGKKSAVTRRWVKNDRLNHAGYLWAFASLRASTGANAHYRRRREQGDGNAAAQRNLFNRMIGQLCHCLQKRESSTGRPRSRHPCSPRQRQPDQRRRLAYRNEDSRSFGHETRSASVRRRRPAP